MRRSLILTCRLSSSSCRRQNGKTESSAADRRPDHGARAKLGYKGVAAEAKTGRDDTLPPPVEWLHKGVRGRPTEIAIGMETPARPRPSFPRLGTQYQSRARREALSA